MSRNNSKSGNFITSRITGGELKNKEIKSPENKVTHPMGSRERLALMNMIGPDVKGAVILDAFAGTGAIGIEALSRGAKHVTFIEKDHKTAEILRRNLKELGIQDNARVFETAVEKIDFDDKFDFIIADPPYDQIKRIKPETFEGLLALTKDRFFLSHPDNFDPHSLDGKLIATKRYAGARISIYKN